MVEARLRVIYGDTDQMGVVYYANYFRYFEFARSEYFRAHGGSYRELEQGGLLLPVVEAHCTYKASARYDDLLVISTTISELRRASLKFSYQLRREGEAQILCTGHTVHACITREGRPTRLPDAITRLFQPGPGGRDERET
ncbi:MAG: acyl-CoA thioesterase [Myxococcota bacterium]|nr:acyl-CoA thioesterase [Myxococcota bacterium]